MTGQAFFVLTALADGPRHGYGIVGEVAELSQDRDASRMRVASSSEGMSVMLGVSGEASATRRGAG